MNLRAALNPFPPTAHFTRVSVCLLSAVSEPAGELLWNEGGLRFDSVT